MADLTLTIATVDRTSSLLLPGMTWVQSTTGISGRADFRLKNFKPSIGDAVTIENTAGTIAFAGVVRAIRTREHDVGEYFCDVTAYDSDMGSYPPFMAPFALSDVDEPTTYEAVMAALAPYEWWRLGESSGTTATGEQGVRNGTYVNTPTLGVTGALLRISDTAATFARASTEYVDCGNALLVGQTNFSISAWVKFTDKTATNIVYCERTNGATRYARLLTDTSGYAVFDYRSTSTAVSLNGTTDLSDGAWHHLAATKAGTAAELFVDGLSVDSDTLVGGDTFLGTEQARIGYDDTPGSLMNGSIDEVAIWRSALSWDSVKRISHSRDIRHPYLSFVEDIVSDGTTTTTTWVVETLEYENAGATQGVLPNQFISLTSANHGLTGYDAPIRELRYSWPNSDTPRLTLTAGDSPVRLPSAFP